MALKLLTVIRNSHFAGNLQIRTKGKKKMRPVKNKKEFRIESNLAMTIPHWPVSGTNEIVVHDRSLAVALAAKTRTEPSGGEVRVVHTPTGEVIFRKHND